MQRARAERVARTASAIDAAVLREVGERGHADLRLASVARRAGVALRTLYLRSEGKDALVDGALRRRAATLGRRVERWQPTATSADGVLDELVALHQRTYRAERLLLESLVTSGAPTAPAILRSLDRVRLAIIARAADRLERMGALAVARDDAIGLLHAVLAYPTWRAALTGPSRRRAPRLMTEMLRSALLR